MKNIFKTKKKEQKESIKNTNTILVRVVEKIGGIKKEIAEIRTFRWVSPEGIPYLRCDEKNDRGEMETVFLELKPDDEFVIEDLNKVSLEKDLEDLNTKLQKVLDWESEHTQKKPDQNKKDLIFDIKKCKAQLKAIENYSKDSTYLIGKSDGMTMYEFSRINGSFHPIKHNLSGNCVYMPTEAKKKSVVLEREKNKQIFPMKKRFNFPKIGAILFFLVLLGLMLWGALGFHELNNESMYAKMIDENKDLAKQLTITQERLYLSQRELSELRGEVLEDEINSSVKMVESVSVGVNNNE